MYFCQISEPEYRAFWDQSPQKSFLSAPKMQFINSDTSYFYGLKQNNKLQAAALVRGKRRSLGLYSYNISGGPLLDYDNPSALTCFFTSLRRELKHKSGFTLKITPNLIFANRDKHGALPPTEIERQDYISALSALGFIRTPFKEFASSPNWLFVLSLSGETESSLLSNMKPNTRRNIKHALARGIKTKDLSYDELPAFYQLLTQTAKQKQFSIRDLDYYQTMYRLFAPSQSISFVSAYLTQSTQPLAAGMFMTIFPEIVHVFGANDKSAIKLGAQYALQWHMIKRALHTKCQFYNFYGIPENLDQSSSYYGVYEFKRGFSGQIRQLIGEFELPLSPLYYGAKLKNKL